MFKISLQHSSSTNRLPPLFQWGTWTFHQLLQIQFSSKKQTEKIRKRETKKKQRHTLVPNSAELASDKKSISREAFGREEREERVPSDRGRDEVHPSAYKVTIQPQRWWVQPKSSSYGTKVDFVIIPNNKLSSHLWEGRA